MTALDIAAAVDAAITLGLALAAGYGLNRLTRSVIVWWRKG